MEGLYGKELDGVYRIDELVGRGGIGAVYKARDTSLDRDVAIKVLHPHFADDPDFRARFLQEARAVASLDHPDIVRVYAFGQDLGMLYIVMDLVAGQTLQAWLKRLADEHKIVALSDGLTIAQRLARALHYAHEEGVLHRDVKPANILLKPIAAALREPGDMPFHPVLTDFGLAKLAEGGLHTQTGATMGTPTYMSPEQCLGLPPDRRSDVYSLGVILFELTTGRVPFEVKSLTDAIRRHTQEPPPPPRSINPDLPVVVENIVLRALAKRQQDRYANAREMASDLRQAIRSSSPNLHVAPILTAEGPVAGLQTRMDGVGGHAITDPSMPAAALRLFPPGSALTVVGADGQSRRVPLDNRHDLSIGRGEENDLRLADGRASRRHARIEVEGGTVSIVDLRSTNGTVVGDSRLLPGVAAPWPPGKPLLIGSSRLQLELGRPLAAPAIAPVSPVGETVAGDALFSAQEAERIGVSSESFALSVEPGGSVSTSFTVMNQGPIVDHFETSVAGIPAEWVPALPPVMRLLPNE
jgi:pSer/pThr/pTyr-binding forkhead associated (FHA) protein